MSEIEAYPSWNFWQKYHKMQPCLKGIGPETTFVLEQAFNP